jgi:parallel beta-helix repeat protein
MICLHDHAGVNIMTIRLPILLILASTLDPANAATYYVDASFGNDTWSGSQSTLVGSPATDGPWQSLAKVSATTLAPGDSVLLKCGGIWYETLTLANSGTAVNPINIGAYPSACANQPIINGATSVPAHNWVKDTGNIYKLTSAINLISHGSFEIGLGNWTKWSPQNNAAMSLTASCASGNGNCMSFTAGSGDSLAISNQFTLLGKQAYTAGFSIKIPVGTTVRAILRRAAAPWDSLGLNTTVVGTGAWQYYTLPFTATASLSNARLDFAIPAGRNIGLDNVKITAQLPAVLGVFDNGKTINIAHHPNRGYNALRPDSLYFSVAENANTVSLTGGGTGSSYLTTGSDFAALAHPSITSGTGIRVRPNAWTLNDRKVASVSGSRLTFDTPSTYPIEKDWGYFLYGQRWMLDEPGEWHYDAAANTVYVWLADSLAPGSRVSLGQRTVGIEASNKSHIRIGGLTIQNVETGVRMQRAANVVMFNMNIFDTLGLGVDAMGSTDSGIESSQILRTTGSAIYAGDFGGSRFRAFDNLIMDSGVSTRNGIVTSLPTGARAAILTGDSADIRENRIYGTSNVGILPLSNSLIAGNHIENTCLILDDCGAIYMGGQSNTNITIENNTVLNVVGGLPGKPATIPTQAQGIYLDELLNNATIRGNTVVNADNGIQIHNAANNLIANNSLYGNRRHHIWLQEGSQKLHPEGDIHSNEVTGNRLFLTTATPAIRQETLLPKTDTDRFAHFDGNLYFTYLWPTISTEAWPGGAALYTLPEWQSDVTSTSLPRNLDQTAREVNSASLGYAAFRILGGNIVPNGNFGAGLTGWSAYNATAPAGQIVLASCAGVGQCLNYTAGGSLSLVNSPNFSVQKDQWYKASFDLKTGANSQSVHVVTRRGGGGSNGYEWLMSAPYTFTGSTSWQRYSFLFKATQTINARDPVTLDLGARVDFHRIEPGQKLSVANLEIVPLSAVDATLRSHVLINPTGATLDMNCPDGDDISLCSEYVRFSDDQSVTWPHGIAPHQSEIIYSRDSSLTDGDGDGIPDSQDSCSGTLALKTVNASGCALGQI